MDTSKSGNVQISQGFEIVMPRSGKAYPVPCEEWGFVKDKLKSVSRPPWILPALAFLSLGACLSTFILILVGGVNAGQNERSLVVAWAVVVAAGVIGLALVALSIKQYRMDKTQVSEVIRQMELIEKRFEQGGATPAPVSLSDLARKSMERWGAPRSNKEAGITVPGTNLRNEGQDRDTDPKT